MSCIITKPMHSGMISPINVSSYPVNCNVSRAFEFRTLERKQKKKWCLKLVCYIFIWPDWSIKKPSTLTLTLEEHLKYKYLYILLGYDDFKFIFLQKYFMLHRLPQLLCILYFFAFHIVSKPLRFCNCHFVISLWVYTAKDSSKGTI